MAIQTLQTLAPSSASTPNSLQLQRAYAQALLNPDHVAPPIQSWTQGVAGIVDALVGGTMARKAGDKEQAQLSAQQAQQTASNGQFADLATALMGGSGGNMPAADPSGAGLVGASGGTGAPLVSQDQVRAFLASNAPDDLKSKVLELWKANVTPQAPDYMAVDGNVWDKTKGRFVAQAPEKDTPDIQEYKFAKQNGYEGTFQQYQTDKTSAGKQPTLVQYALEAGLKPGTPEYQKFITDRAGGGVSVTTNVGANEMDKLFAKRYDDLASSGSIAQETIPKLDRMLELAKDPKFYSGAGSWPILLMKQGIAALGGDANAAAPMEEFQALANKAVIDSMGGSLGTGFSNADRQYVDATVPNLDATPEGNIQRAKILRLVSQRKVEAASLADKYVEEHGKLDSGFNQLLRQYGEEHPLFADLPKNSPTAAPTISPAEPAPPATPRPGVFKSKDGYTVEPM